MKNKSARIDTDIIAIRNFLLFFDLKNAKIRITIINKNATTTAILEYVKYVSRAKNTARRQNSTLCLLKLAKANDAIIAKTRYIATKLILVIELISIIVFDNKFEIENPVKIWHITNSTNAIIPVYKKVKYKNSFVSFEKFINNQYIK